MPNPVPPPADFPVTWRRPEDAQFLWSHDRLHYPSQVTPLEFSLIEDGSDAGITKAARAYDIPITVHDRHINGYLYVAIETHPQAGTEAAALAQDPSAGLLRAMADLRTSWDRDWLPEIQRHLAWWAGFDRAGATLPELRRHLAESVQRWQRLWEVHFLLLMPSLLAMSEFDDRYTELFGDQDRFAPYDLLNGIPGKTLESSQELWALSRRVLASPGLLKLFAEHAGTDVLRPLGESAEGRQFLTELDEYLAVHGRRADKLTISDPFWIEDPAPVIHSLRNYLEEPDRDLGEEMRRVGEERQERVAQLLATLQNYPPPVRDRMESLLGAAQAGAFLAEEHNYWIDHGASFEMRQVLLTIGARLEAAGALDEAGDLFYLQLGEVQELLASEDPATLFKAQFREAVAARRGQAERFAHVAPPPLLGTVAQDSDGSPDPFMRIFGKAEGDMRPPQATNGLIVGSPASPGVVKGTVKVLHDFTEASKVEPGDIVVTETTAPPWTALLTSAGGLVTSSGGILSHSAVVSRELGIPAVVGATMATQLLRDGQRVEVDGSQGTVRILS